MAARSTQTLAYARTDRTYSRLLCGIQDLDGRWCTGRMGLIKVLRYLPVQSCVVHISLEPGFSRDTVRPELWRLSVNAQRRKERGYSAKYRTSPKRSDGWVFHGPNSPVWDDPGRIGPRGEVQQDGSVWPSHIPLSVDRPQRIVCPDCKREQILDLRRLVPDGETILGGDIIMGELGPWTG